LQITHLFDGEYAVSKIISIHSYRGGTGKSNTSANLATLLAAEGRRVGVVDTDIMSPGIHVLFGLGEDAMQFSLNDYLWGKCDIKQTAHDVTPPGVTGKIFLIPSSIKVGEITRILREGYDPGLLTDGFHSLMEKMNLDALVIDTHPGLNEETILSIAISDALAIILRPDQQDFQGTAITVEVARKLDIPRMGLIVNKAPTALDFDTLKKQVEKSYNAEVAAILPHSDEMMILGSAGVFVTRYPDHPITQSLKKAAAFLIS
jgi:MinD-like ATPase involved in chromosome partitioning or flagellar assembly